jgi:hypothetical protein
MSSSWKVSGRDNKKPEVSLLGPNLVIIILYWEPHPRKPNSIISHMPGKDKGKAILHEVLKMTLNIQCF